MRQHLVLIALLFSCALAACGDNDGVPKPVAATEQRRLLFLLYSDGGELRDNGNGTYVFRMTEVWETVVAFADRPFRDALSSPLQAWIANWNANGFDKNPPNAAVTMLVNGSVQITDWAILTLTNPRFAADGTLEFNATFLTLPNGEPAFFPTEAGAGVKPSFLTTQVFVDSTGTAAGLYRTCSSSEVSSCVGVSGCNRPNLGGCCLATSPAGCFNPSATDGQPDWIGFTPCGQAANADKACLVASNPVPTATSAPIAPTSTPTPVSVPGTSTPTPPSGATVTATATGGGTTPTVTPTAGGIRLCGPADPGGKACDNARLTRCTSDSQCPGSGHCVTNEGGCLRDCKGKFCCTQSGACWDHSQTDGCNFTGTYPAGCYGTDGKCRDDVVCDARDDIPPPTPAVHQITIVNGTDQTIWVGGLTGGHNPSPVDVGGWDWKLAPAGDAGHGDTHTITVPYGWNSGRLWPRTGCVAGAGSNDLTCATGDCKGKRTCEVSGTPPAILAELTLDGGDNPGQPDNYNASAVDGWNNIVVTINPIVEGSFPGQWCGTAGCTGTPSCPTGYSATYSKDGTVLGCSSPCKATDAGTHPDLALKLCCACSNTDSGCTCDSGGTCCDDKFGCSPFYPTGQPNPLNRLCIPTGTATREDGTQLNRPDSKWDDVYLDYIDNFKAACPRTYSWQFDDLDNLFKCQNTPGQLLDYRITFHPAKVS